MAGLTDEDLYGGNPFVDSLRSAGLTDDEILGLHSYITPEQWGRQADVRAGRERGARISGGANRAAMADLIGGYERTLAGARAGLLDGLMGGGDFNPAGPPPDRPEPFAEERARMRESYAENARLQQSGLAREQESLQIQEQGDVGAWGQVKIRAAQAAPLLGDLVAGGIVGLSRGGLPGAIVGGAVGGALGLGMMNAVDPNTGELDLEQAKGPALLGAGIGAAIPATLAAVEFGGPMAMMAASGSAYTGLKRYELGQERQREIETGLPPRLGAVEGDAALAAMLPLLPFASQVFKAGLGRAQRGVARRVLPMMMRVSSPEEFRADLIKRVGEGDVKAAEQLRVTELDEKLAEFEGPASEKPSAVGRLLGDETGAARIGRARSKPRDPLDDNANKAYDPGKSLAWRRWTTRTLSNWAIANSDQRHWYKVGRVSIDARFGDTETRLFDNRTMNDAELMRSFIPVTSPQRDPHVNVGLAMDALIATKQGKKIVPNLSKEQLANGDTIAGLYGDDAVTIKGATRTVARMLREVQDGHLVSSWDESYLRGTRKAKLAARKEGESEYEWAIRTKSRPKVISFHHNLTSAGDFVTADLWMARMLLGDEKPGSGSAYREVVDRVRKVAVMTGMSPEEVQAALWYQMRRTYGKRAETDMVFLKKSIDTGRPSQSTNSMLQDYRAFLEKDVGKKSKGLDENGDEIVVEGLATKRRHLAVLLDYERSGKWTPEVKQAAASLMGQVDRLRSRYMSNQNYENAFEKPGPAQKYDRYRQLVRDETGSATIGRGRAEPIPGKTEPNAEDLRLAASETAGGDVWDWKTETWRKPSETFGPGLLRARQRYAVEQAKLERDKLSPSEREAVRASDRKFEALQVKRDQQAAARAQGAATRRAQAEVERRAVEDADRRARVEREMAEGKATQAEMAAGERPGSEASPAPEPDYSYTFAAEVAISPKVTAHGGLSAEIDKGYRKLASNPALHGKVTDLYFTDSVARTHDILGLPEGLVTFAPSSRNGWRGGITDPGSSFTVHSDDMGVVRDVVDVLQVLHQQEEMAIFRRNPQGQSAGVHLYHDKLADPELRRDVYNAIADELKKNGHPDLPAGWSQTRGGENGQTPGLTTVFMDHDEARTFLDAMSTERAKVDFATAVDKVEQEFDLPGLMADVDNFDGEMRYDDEPGIPTGRTDTGTVGGRSAAGRLVQKHGPGITELLDRHHREALSLRKDLLGPAQAEHFRQRFTPPPNLTSFDAQVRAVAGKLEIQPAVRVDRVKHGRVVGPGEPPFLTITNDPRAWHGDISQAHGINYGLLYGGVNEKIEIAESLGGSGEIYTRNFVEKATDKLYTTEAAWDRVKEDYGSDHFDSSLTDWGDKDLNSGQFQQLLEDAMRVAIRVPERDWTEAVGEAYRGAGKDPRSMPRRNDFPEPVDERVARRDMMIREAADKIQADRERLAARRIASEFPGTHEDYAVARSLGLSEHEIDSLVRHSAGHKTARNRMTRAADEMGIKLPHALQRLLDAGRATPEVHPSWGLSPEEIRKIRDETGSATIGRAPGEGKGSVPYIPPHLARFHGDPLNAPYIDQALASRVQEELVAGRTPEDIFADHIRLSKVGVDPQQSVDEIHAITRVIADLAAPETRAARRGTVTWEQTANESSQYLGLHTRRSVEKWKIREAGASAHNAAELEAMGRVMDGYNTEVLKLAQGLRTQYDPLKYRQLVDTLHEARALSASFQGAQAEAGRMLNILRKVRDPYTVARHLDTALGEMELGRSPDAVLEILDQAGRAQVQGERAKAARIIKALPDATTWDKIIELAQATAIGYNPLTYTANILGNTGMQAWDVGQKLLAGLYADARETVTTGGPRRLTLRRARLAQAEYAKADKIQAEIDAVNQDLSVLATHRDQLGVGRESPIELRARRQALMRDKQTALEAGKALQELAMRPYPEESIDLVRGMIEGFVEAAHAVGEGAVRLEQRRRGRRRAGPMTVDETIRQEVRDKLAGQHSGIKGDQRKSTFTGPTRYLTQASFWPLTLMDTFQSRMNDAAAMRSHARRIARSEGLTGHEEIGLRVERLVDDARWSRLEGDPNELALRAENYAAVQTLQNKLGPQAGAMVRFVRNIPQPLGLISRLVWLFQKTLVNATAWSLKRNPAFSWMYPSTRNALTGRLGREAHNEMVGQMLMGSAVMGGLLYLHNQGKITGSFNRRNQPGYADAREAQGEQEYSFVTPSGAHIPMRGMEPLSTVLTLTLDVEDAIRKGALDERDATQVITALELSIGNTVQNQSFASQIARTVLAVSDGDRYGKGMAEGFATVFIPTVGGYIDRLQDPYLRRATTLLERAKLRAGLSGPVPEKPEDFFKGRDTQEQFVLGMALDAVPPRQDMWGDPIYKPGGLLLRNQTTRRVPDPVAGEIARLAESREFSGLTQPKRKLRDLQKEIPGWEFALMFWRARQRAKQDLTRQIVGPDGELRSAWKHTPDSDKANTIRGVAKDYWDLEFESWLETARRNGVLTEDEYNTVLYGREAAGSMRPR